MSWAVYLVYVDDMYYFPLVEGVLKKSFIKIS